MTMAIKKWPAPAKLNLFLHITGRRDDGYHLLQTVFQFIDYCDELQFSLRDDGQIDRPAAIEGVSAEDDITVKAARLLQSTANSRLGVDIHIDKKIPMGGGLGGGSSNAATTLLALNHLWQAGLDINQLAALGLQLGADVPVFVRGFAAWAEGVGETLSPVKLPEPWFLVLRPPVHVATGAIFSDSDLTRNCPPITIRDLADTAATRNVCEPVVRKHYREVDQALQWLSNYGEARMTGTGSCVFVAFETEVAAQQALAAFQAELADKTPSPWLAFVAKGLNQSPLFALMDTLNGTAIEQK